MSRMLEISSSLERKILKSVEDIIGPLDPDQLQCCQCQKWKHKRKFVAGNISDTFLNGSWSSNSMSICQECHIETIARCGVSKYITKEPTKSISERIWGFFKK